MLNKLKKEFNRNPKALTAGIAVIFILAVIIPFQYMDSLRMFWPHEEIIKKYSQELKTKQAELQEVLDDESILSSNRKSFIKHRADFWISRRDGNTETDPQKKIEGIAKNAGLNLTSLGRIQSTKICEGAHAMNLTIAAKAPMNEISDFIAGLHGVKPLFYWRTLSLRPNNIKNPTGVVLSGSLQFISVTDDTIVDRLLEKE